MSIPSRFTGQVTMFSTRPGFAGPKVEPLGFDARFEGDGAWRVEPADFGAAGRVVIEAVETGQPFPPRADLVVTLRQTARGRSTSVEATIELDANFRFHIALRGSSLELKLDGGSYMLGAGGPAVAGRPLGVEEAAVCIAGTAVFSGGWLSGDRCLVQLEGRFEPNPWQAPES